MNKMCNIKFFHEDCKICDECTHCEGMGIILADWKKGDIVFCTCSKGDQAKTALINWINKQDNEKRNPPTTSRT